MANIQPYIDAINDAVYGEEVRGAIRDALSAINDDVESRIETYKEKRLSFYDTCDSHIITFQENAFAFDQELVDISLYATTPNNTGIDTIIVDDKSFFKCSKLQTLGSNSQKISFAFRDSKVRGEYAFSGCDSINLQNILNRVINVDDGKTEILKGCFSEWNPPGRIETQIYADIIIPDGTTVLYEDVFRNSYGIGSILIPYTIKSINQKCFYGITRNNRFSVPKALTVMYPGSEAEFNDICPAGNKAYAFDDLSNVTFIYNHSS